MENIVDKKFRSLKRALNFLESLVSRGSFIFRGHNNSTYELETTLKRRSDFATAYPDEYIEEFKTRLARHGLLPSFCKTPLDWMEYARHCGVPSPVIDFTYSPYVALFFAFNGVRPEKKKSVLIYAVDIEKLAHAWAYQEASYHCNRNEDPQQWGKYYSLTYHNFLGWNKDFISSTFPNTNQGHSSFPMDFLQIIPYPNRFNRRMLIQQGLFLYDTLCRDLIPVNSRYDWYAIRWLNLEDWISNAHNPDDEPIIYKIFLPKKGNIIEEALLKLDMMNITAGALFETPDAIAEDIRNSWFYNSRLGIR